MVIKYRELRKKSKGFTLIELMIVVAIIAILAAIAIPQYRKFQLKAKTAEAKTNIGAIRTCEEAYAAEHDQYYKLSPAPSDSNIKASPRNWNETTDGTSKNFGTIIGFKPAGKVYFNYAVDDISAYGGKNFNSGSDLTATAITGVTDGAVTAHDDTADIAILAQGDLDGDNLDSMWGCTDEKGNIVHGVNSDDF